MLVLDRSALAAQIVDRLASRREQLRAQWQRDSIANFIVDDLLPLETARALFEAFPPPAALTARHNLRESRFVGARLDAYPELLRETISAFQLPRVIEAIGRLTDLPGLLRSPQPNASGISVMERGSFVHPHVDGSHDEAQLNRHVLSVLYYVTPDLRLSDGGHLELWHEGPEAEPTTILSKFNRLVVVARHAGAWHSVSPLRANRRRCCLWSYYYRAFSVQPHNDNDNHVAAFRARPEQRVRDLLLRADTFARQSLYRLVLERGWVDPGVWAEDPLFARADEPSSAPRARDGGG